MSSIISKIATVARNLYQQTEDFIEEERSFTVSQNLLNATFQKYVTDNVGLLKDLHADLYDDWLRLYATVNVAGIYASLSVDLKLVQMIFNQDQQYLVFEQISKTQVIEARIKGKFKNMAVRAALYFYQQVLDKDPLAPILQKYNIVEMKHGLLYLSLNRWLGRLKPVTNTLQKVQVNHGVLRETKLILKTNVNLDAVLKRGREPKIFEDWELEELELADDQITPIRD